MPTIRAIAAARIGTSKAVHCVGKSGPWWFDAMVERVVLDAPVPDQIEVALAAAGQLEQESRQLERQWALRVERARYAAEPLPWQKSRSGTRFHAST
jgi:hypothetical protein